MVIIDMNLKIVMLISILLAMAWPIVGLEPIHLGNGFGDKVINLDAGARLPSQSFNFAGSGFVAPRMPQSMALSPNIMITQAKKLMNEAQLARDESVSARDEAKAILNETRALLAEINKKEQNILSLQKKAESDREATAASATQAGVFLNKTDETCRKMLALSIEIDGKLSQINTTLKEARNYANASDIDVSGDGSFIDTIRASVNV